MRPTERVQLAGLGGQQPGGASCLCLGRDFCRELRKIEAQWLVIHDTHASVVPSHAGVPYR